MRFRAINFACVLVALAVVVHVVPAANAAAIAPTLVKRILVKRGIHHLVDRSPFQSSYVYSRTRL